MRVRVLAFASAAEAIGCRQLDVELPSGASVGELRRLLEGDHPALRELWPRLALAVDGELVSLEANLAPGSEVALLPPVSGGSEPQRTALVEGPIDVDELLAAVRARGRGATLLFLGSVRETTGGRRVARILYDAYRPMAARRLAAIVRELEAGEDGVAVAIAHRLGEVPAGEPSLAIAVAAPHREAAYRVSRRAIERLKREVPIWKREHFADGESVWREVEPLAPPTDRLRAR